MSKLPVISDIKAVKALTRVGFSIDHQTGSHIIMRKEGSKPVTISVPKHKEMKAGSLLERAREVLKSYSSQAIDSEKNGSSNVDTKLNRVCWCLFVGKAKSLGE